MGYQIAYGMSFQPFVPPPHVLSYISPLSPSQKKRKKKELLHVLLYKGRESFCIGVGVDAGNVLAVEFLYCPQGVLEFFLQRPLGEDVDDPEEEDFVLVHADHASVVALVEGPSRNTLAILVKHMANLIGATGIPADQVPRQIFVMDPKKEGIIQEVIFF